MYVVQRVEEPLAWLLVDLMPVTKEMWVNEVWLCQEDLQWGRFTERVQRSVTANQDAIHMRQTCFFWRGGTCINMAWVPSKPNMFIHFLYCIVFGARRALLRHLHWELPRLGFARSHKFEDTKNLQGVLIGGFQTHKTQQGWHPLQCWAYCLLAWTGTRSYWVRSCQVSKNRVLARNRWRRRRSLALKLKQAFWLGHVGT